MLKIWTLAALAGLTITGCHTNRAVITTDTKQPASPATPSISPGDIEVARAKACSSLVVSRKAMSIKQHWFANRNPTIDWRTDSAKEDMESMIRAFTVWSRSLDMDTTEAVPVEIQTKLKAYAATSKAVVKVYSDMGDKDEITNALIKDDQAFHEAAKACGKE